MDWVSSGIPVVMDFSHMNRIQNNGSDRKTKTIKPVARTFMGHFVADFIMMFLK
jgi:hypothetical protein